MSHFECPPPQDLNRFLLGDLDEGRFAELEAHIESCQDCLRRIEGLETASAVFDKDPWDADPAAQFLNEDECQAVVERMASINPDAPSVPDQLGPYRILEQLGQGGMGTVYKAWHTRLKRFVAVKVLPPQYLQSSKTQTRFHREMEAVGALDHPLIVRGSDAGEEAGIHYLVMEYVDGFDLARLVERHGPLSVSDACELIRQAAEGLQYAHERGLIHRDIKPSNLILSLNQPAESPSTVRGREEITVDPTAAGVKILDFGLARWHSAEGDSPDLTSADQLMGTLDFMAPEQATDSRNVGIRADIYSLGATLYKLLTGRSPLDAHGNISRLEKLFKLASTDSPSVGDFNPAVPRRLIKLISQTLSRDADKRPATPGDLARLLQPFTTGADLVALLHRVREARQEQANTQQPAVAGASRQRSLALRWLPQIVIAACLVALLLAGAYWRIVIAATPVDHRSTVTDAGRSQPKSTGPTETAASVPSLAVAPFDAQAAEKFQQDWAKHLAVPLEFTNDVGMKFRLIPPGEFLMGSSEAELAAALQLLGDNAHWQRNFESEGPQHRVRLSKAFYLATTPVTQGQYEHVMGTTPSHFCKSGLGRDIVREMDTREFPVESMTYVDASEFCRRLTDKDRASATGAVSQPRTAESTTSGYRLPTEAEWEFACRAGTTTRYWSGDTEADLNGVAWMARQVAPRPANVGSLRANPFGLYDIHGNIFELCDGWWTPHHTPDLGAPISIDPQSPPTGDARVARGGDWSAGGNVARAATRAAHIADSGNFYCGFRVALSVEDFRRQKHSE